MKDKTTQRLAWGWLILFVLAVPGFLIWNIAYGFIDNPVHPFSVPVAIFVLVATTAASAVVRPPKPGSNT